MSNIPNPNFTNTNTTAPIFQSQPLTNASIPTSSFSNSFTSNDPFEKLINRSLNTSNEKNSTQTISLNQNLENYKKQIEQLDLEQLKMERKRLVDQIVNYMREGKTELLEEAQQKYKIAMQVSDSKVMNFSASAIASSQENKNLAKDSSSEDFLKKLQESEILPPDNSAPPIIPQQTNISQNNSSVNTTETSVTSIGTNTLSFNNLNTINSENPNIQITSIPTSSFNLNPVNLNPVGMINNSNFGLINTLNSMNPNQMNSLFSNPSGMFNSLNNLLVNAMNPVHPYSPLMTSYGVYAPNLRKDPIMNSFLNGELYPLDMADMGVMSALNRELFRKNED
ncbi:MAG: hypothetical protein ACK4GJ_06225 [bacterium]